jgi:hypothetical protein
MNDRWPVSHPQKADFMTISRQEPFIMIHHVQARLYRNLNTLIPQLAARRSGAYFAPARVAGDMAIYCTVDMLDDGRLAVQIADDERTDGDEAPNAWICLVADPAYGLAGVTWMQEGWEHQGPTGGSYAERLRIDLYAANWLAMFVTLGRRFHPVDMAVAA